MAHERARAVRNMPPRPGAVTAGVTSTGLVISTPFLPERLSWGGKNRGDAMMRIGHHVSLLLLLESYQPPSVGDLGSRSGRVCPRFLLHVCQSLRFRRGRG